MTARLAILTIGMAILVGVSGCGGGDSGSSGSGASGSGASASGGASESSSSSGEESSTIATASIGKAQFVKQFNALCQSDRSELVTKITGYISKHEKDGSDEEVFVDSLRAVYFPQIEAEVVKMEEVGAPAGDEAQIEAFISAQRSGIEEAEKLQKADSFAPVEAPFKPASKLALAYGLDKCARSS